MDEELTINDKELARLVKNWLRLKGSRRDVYSCNVMGQTLKQELKRLGHWKNARRGDAAKGYKAMQNKLNE